MSTKSNEIFATVDNSAAFVGSAFSLDSEGPIRPLRVERNLRKIQTQGGCWFLLYVERGGRFVRVAAGWRGGRT